MAAYMVKEPKLALPPITSATRLAAKEPKRTPTLRSSTAAHTALSILIQLVVKLKQQPTNMFIVVIGVTQSALYFGTQAPCRDTIWV